MGIFTLRYFCRIILTLVSVILFCPIPEMGGSHHVSFSSLFSNSLAVTVLRQPVQRISTAFAFCLSPITSWSEIIRRKSFDFASFSAIVDSSYVNSWESCILHNSLLTRINQKFTSHLKVKLV